MTIILRYEHSQGAACRGQLHPGNVAKSMTLFAAFHLHFRRAKWPQIFLFFAVAAFAVTTSEAAPARRPNIILVMADDLGWGDVAYNGNPKVKTPTLDALAKTGVRLDRFYAGGPVCTPTRASCLTGRNPNRYGTLWAGRYPLPPEELTLAELLRDGGYRTGFFGKWHLGKMTPARDEGFGERKYDPQTYSPPWQHGFETNFAIESAVPNYNPEVWDQDWNLMTNDPAANKFIMDRPLAYGEGTLVGKPLPRWPFRFWHGEAAPAKEPIAGDSSELIVNHAGRFIEASIKQQVPFLAVVWFVVPHTPVAAGNDARALYPELPIREQHWFGAISAMDAQIGRLLKLLRHHRADENTLVWFCSDNGPSWVHELASAGPLRGKKSELYEGGIRVPSIVSWPAALRGGRSIEVPISTNDFLPTILAATGVSPTKLLPLDGQNVLPILQAKTHRRTSPLFFDYPAREPGSVSWVPTDARQTAVIEGEWKLLSVDSGKSYQLFNIERDRSEQSDQAATNPERVQQLREALSRWQAQCAVSLKRGDYRD